MQFVGRLCEALGCTLAEVDAMSAAEFAFWGDYYRRSGFASDRLQVTIARGLALVARAWGWRGEPEDLMPKFGAGASVNNKVLAARLGRLPGAKVRLIPRPDRNPGEVRESGETQPRSRVLNPKGK